MSVHQFPPRFIDDCSYPPQRVILAPDPITRHAWIAWVIGQRGSVILESGDISATAGDAYNFAGRFGLEVEEQLHPLVWPDSAPRRFNGTIHVYPCETVGGSWAVDHEGRSGDSYGLLGTRFSYDEAVRLAKAKAAELGAALAGGIA